MSLILNFILPPVDFRAVCFVRAMAEDDTKIDTRLDWCSNSKCEGVVVE